MKMGILRKIESNIAIWKATEAENMSLKQEMAILKTNLDVRFKELEAKVQGMNAIAVSQNQ